jgi:polyferredoxin
VAVCPTGIDIRNGLQMECVHCTQCIDACNTVMDKVGQPRGLIRYATRDGLEGKPRKVVRPRTIIYPAAFSLFFGGFLFTLGTKATADVTFLGANAAAPYTVEQSGGIVNPVRVKIANRGGTPRKFRVTITDAPDAKLIAPTLPLAVEAGKFEVAGMFVVLPPEAFANGIRTVTFRVEDGEGFTEDVSYRLAGPRRDAAAPTRSTP